MCGTAHRQRIVAQTRIVYDFCAAFTIASANCAISTSLIRFSIAVF